MASGLDIYDTGICETNSGDKIIDDKIETVCLENCKGESSFCKTPAKKLSDSGIDMSFDSKDSNRVTGENQTLQHSDKCDENLTYEQDESTDEKSFYKLKMKAQVPIDFLGKVGEISDIDFPKCHKKLMEESQTFIVCDVLQRESKGRSEIDVEPETELQDTPNETVDKPVRKHFFMDKDGDDGSSIAKKMTRKTTKGKRNPRGKLSQVLEPKRTRKSKTLKRNNVGVVTKSRKSDRKTKYDPESKKNRQTYRQQIRDIIHHRNNKNSSKSSVINKTAMVKIHRHSICIYDVNRNLSRNQNSCNKTPTLDSEHRYGNLTSVVQQQSGNPIVIENRSKLYKDRPKEIINTTFLSEVSYKIPWFNLDKEIYMVPFISKSAFLKVFPSKERSDVNDTFICKSEISAVYNTLCLPNILYTCLVYPCYRDHNSFDYVHLSALRFRNRNNDVNPTALNNREQVPVQNPTQNETLVNFRENRHILHTADMFRIILRNYSCRLERSCLQVVIDYSFDIHSLRLTTESLDKIYRNWNGNTHDFHVCLCRYRHQFSHGNVIDQMNETHSSVLTNVLAGRNEAMSNSYSFQVCDNSTVLMLEVDHRFQTPSLRLTNESNQLLQMHLTGEGAMPSVPSQTVPRPQTDTGIPLSTLLKMEMDYSQAIPSLRATPQSLRVLMEQDTNRHQIYPIQILTTEFRRYSNSIICLEIEMDNRYDDSCLCLTQESIRTLQAVNLQYGRFTNNIQFVVILRESQQGQNKVVTVEQTLAQPVYRENDLPTCSEQDTINIVPPSSLRVESLSESKFSIESSNITHNLIDNKNEYTRNEELNGDDSEDAMNTERRVVGDSGYQSALREYNQNCSFLNLTEEKNGTEAAHVRFDVMKMDSFKSQLTPISDGRLRKRSKAGEVMVTIKYRYEVVARIIVEKGTNAQDIIRDLDDVVTPLLPRNWNSYCLLKDNQELSKIEENCTLEVYRKV